MFSWRDTRWYWLIRYTDLKSVSKPLWYLRSSNHLRSQSQLKYVRLRGKIRIRLRLISNLLQVNLVYTISLSSGHDLSKFDSNLVEVWQFCNIVIFCLLFVFKSSSGHSVTFPQFELKSWAISMRGWWWGGRFSIFIGGSDKDMTDLGMQQSQLRSLIDSSPQLGLPPKLLLEEESENKQVQCSKTLFMLISKYLSKYLFHLR